MRYTDGKSLASSERIDFWGKIGRKYILDI